MSMSKPDPDSGAYAPRIRRSRSGWTWKAPLALAALACAFAGAAQAQDYPSLESALSRIIGEIVDDGDLRGKKVLVSPNSFIEMGTERNLRLSDLLARRSVPELRRLGARPVSGSDDEDRAVTLRGEWNIEHESGEPYLYLFIEAKQLVGNNELSTLASDHGRIPVASIDRRSLEPDIESHGRHVVRRLERSIAGADGRYRLHVRPFTLQGMAQPESERFNRYLLGRWRPAFAGSRRFRLVGPARFDGELHGDVFVVGERIEVGLYIRDDQEREVAAAFVEMDRSLFPPGMFGPDVRELLARCAGEVDAGRLEAAEECYEEVRALAPGDPDAGDGVRAGLERIARARVEAAVGDVEEAIGRGELGEARRRLEDLRRLDAGHPRLAGLEEEMVRAEREGEDDEAFARAKGEGTVAALDGYLSLCGEWCGHAEEARRLRAVVRDRFLPGKKFRDCPECPELVVVPSGSYMMGSTSGRSNEEPVHRVTIERPFAVGVKEVTFGEWDACVSDRGCGGYRPGDRGWGRGKRPVINVSWTDAQGYVRWLSRKTGEEYRLLSESEWEYVARAGTGTRYWWGDAVGRNRANCHGCGSRWDAERTAPVGSFSANPFGLHDVHGNVWEWVEDCWNGGYHGAPSDGRAWTSGECSRRVLRGGSLQFIPQILRSAFRSGVTTGYRGSSNGFRVARTLTP